jgi:hypothetical protein
MKKQDIIDNAKARKRGGTRRTSVFLPLYDLFLLEEASVISMRTVASLIREAIATRFENYPDLHKAARSRLAAYLRMQRKNGSTREAKS